MRNWMLTVIIGLSFALFFFPMAAKAQCTAGPHSGTITADQRWCASDSPHNCSGSVTIAPGVTVTIEAGVTVNADYRSNLTIQGRLVTLGTAAQPVTFTGTQWTGLKFTGGTGDLFYCSIVNANWTDPSITASNVPSPGLVIDHCTVGPDGYGLLIDSSNVAVSNSAFTNVSSYYPIDVRGVSSVLSLSNNTFSANSPNRILLELGAMSAADFTLIPQAGLDAYELAPNYTIPNGRTVTLAAGTTILAGYRANVTIQGTLVTQGTAAQPVTFTGPQWTGLNFAGGSGDLSYCKVVNANWTEPSITVSNVPSPGLLIDHCTVGPDGYGLLIDSSKVTVSDSAFTNISNYPIYVKGASSVLSLSNNSFSGNIPNHIALDPAAMSGADFTLIPQIGLEGYELRDNYTIPSGRTVTLAAGVTVVPAWRGNLTILGRLVAQGTAAHPVTFSNGQWGGLNFNGGTGDLLHCILTNGGFNYWSITASNVTTGEVRLESCRVINGSGIYGTNSHVTLINTVVSDDGGQAWAIQMTNGSSLTATHTTFARNPDVASIETGSTATFTNTIVANSPTGWGISNDGSATVTMTRTLWDTVAMPTNGAVTQNGFINGTAAFASDGYHLSSNSAALGQAVATLVTNDIDDEIRPQPARTLPDLGADEASLAAPLNRTPTPIALATPKSGTATNGAFGDYALNLSSGQAKNLLVRLTPLGGTGTWSLFGRLGAYPYTTFYDATGVLKPDGTLEMLIAAPAPGTWYFSVFYLDQSGGTAPYTLQVIAVDRYLSSINPASGGNTGSLSAQIAGIGFVAGMRVELRNASATLRSFTPVAWNNSTLGLSLNLTGLAAQKADVAAVWPDGGEQMLSGAFQVLAGGAANLQATLIIPDKVRIGRPTTLFLEYRNAGTEDMAAPLFMVSSEQNVPMRLESTDAFQRQPVQILGIDPRGLGTAGTLAPGEARRIAFQILPEGPAHQKLGFDLLVLDPDSTTLIDWASLEPEFRSSEIDADAWSALWVLFHADVGTTVADWGRALRRSANALSAHGRFVYDPSLLCISRLTSLAGWGIPTDLSSSLDASAPAPGLPLSFVRAYPNTILSHMRLGPFGRGWRNVLWDTVLTTSSTGDIVIRGASNEIRRFSPQADGTYRSTTDDPGWLFKTAGLFTLTETDLRVLVFRTDGLLGSITDRFGNRIDLDYDSSGHLTRIRHSSGDLFQLAWNGSGRIVQLTDQAGRVTTYGYDASGGHLISVTSPDGRVWSYAYAAATGGPTDHALTSITLPDGTHRFFEYDAQGRISHRSADGGAEPISYGYGAATRTMTDGAGNTSSAAFDEFGKLIAVADASGNWGQLDYDDNGNIVRVTDASGAQAHLSYGPQGEPTSVVDPMGGQALLRRVYPAGGGIFTSGLIDPNRNVSTFELGSRHEPTAIDFPDGSKWQFTVDAHGKATSVTNRSGQSTSFSFNARGQALQKNSPDGTSITYQYDTLGRLTRATGPDGVISLDYDARGFPARITEPDGSYISYEYNDVGKRTRRTTSDGSMVNYAWDAAGRLSGVRDDSGGLIIHYTYDTAGRISREDRGNGTWTATTYEPSGHPASIVHHAADGSVQESYTYKYDVRGNPVQVTSNAGVTAWAWDALDQLIQVQEPSGRVVTYSYDASGNRVQVVDSGTATSYTSNSLNQVTQAGTATFSYDADGNLLSRTDASGATSYEYDSDGRLARVTHPTAGIFEYQYDSLGRLKAEIHGSAVTQFRHDLEFIESERDGTGAVTARYVQGYGLAARLASGGNSYYAFDITGSTRLVTDAAGSVVNRYDWGPFGEPRTAVEGLPNAYRYAGRWGIRTEGHGLLLMGARTYDPSLGRFIEPDPAGYLSGYNVYAYCANSPIQQIDPSGLEKLAGDIINTGKWFFSFVKNGITPGLSAAHGLYSSISDIVNGIKGGDGNAIVHGLGKLSWTAGSFVGGLWMWVETESTMMWFYGAEGLEGYEATATVMVAGVPLAPVLVVVGTVIAADEVGTDLYLEEVKQKLAELKGGIIPRNPYAMFPPDQRPKGGFTKEFLQGWKILYKDKDHSDQTSPGDPNEKIATPGVGPQHIVKAGTRLSYAVYFENIPTASAPAQEVIITDQLDANLDWSTLRLTGFGWGANAISLPAGGTSFSQSVIVPDYRVGNPRKWQVDVTGELSGSGAITWRFRTIDPATGDLPADVLAGFLPPDDASGSGEGFVSFTVNSKAALPAGTQITNTSAVVFDQNPSINTNQTSNIIGIPGDANNDGKVDLFDLIYLLNYFYSGGPPPVGLADCNGDGVVSVLDLFYLINYLFAGGPAPID